MTGAGVLTANRSQSQDPSKKVQPNYATGLRNADDAGKAYKLENLSPEIGQRKNSVKRGSGETRPIVRR